MPHLTSALGGADAGANWGWVGGLGGCRGWAGLGRLGALGRLGGRCIGIWCRVGCWI